jgi:hypothetical protein
MKVPGSSGLPWPPPQEAIGGFGWNQKTSEGMSVLEALEIMFEMVTSTSEAMAKATRVVKAERSRLLKIRRRSLGCWHLFNCASTGTTATRTAPERDSLSFRE